MELNQTQFAKVVEAAKLKAAGSARWIAAIDKAASGVNGGWIVTELHNGIMVTTESGNTYHANGACQCAAFRNNQPCKHRALARLIELYNEGCAAARQVPVPTPHAAWRRRLGKVARWLGRVFWFARESRA